jgi:hypothetical protein
MFGPILISNRYKGKVALLSRTMPVNIKGGIKVKFKIQALEDNLLFSCHW